MEGSKLTFLIILMCLCCLTSASVTLQVNESFCALDTVVFRCSTTLVANNGFQRWIRNGVSVLYDSTAVQGTNRTLGNAFIILDTKNTQPGSGVTEYTSRAIIMDATEENIQMSCSDGIVLQSVTTSQQDVPCPPRVTCSFGNKFITCNFFQLPNIENCCNKYEVQLSSGTNMMTIPVMNGITFAYNLLEYESVHNLEWFCMNANGQKSNASCSPPLSIISEPPISVIRSATPRDCSGTNITYTVTGFNNFTGLNVSNNAEYPEIVQTELVSCDDCTLLSTTPNSLSVTAKHARAFLVNLTFTDETGREFHRSVYFGPNTCEELNMRRREVIAVSTLTVVFGIMCFVLSIMVIALCVKIWWIKHPNPNPNPNQEVKELEEK